MRRRFSHMTIHASPRAQLARTRALGAAIHVMPAAVRAAARQEAIAPHATPGDQHRTSSKERAHCLKASVWSTALSLLSTIVPRTDTAACCRHRVLASIQDLHARARTDSPAMGSTAPMSMSASRARATAKLNAQTRQAASAAHVSQAAGTQAMGMCVAMRTSAHWASIIVWQMRYALTQMVASRAHARRASAEWATPHA